MKTISKRNYHLTDSELITFTNVLIQNMTRDAAEFTIKGVLPAAATALGILNTAFQNLPSDSYYQADVSIAVEAKDNYRINAEKNIRAIVNLARIKWGEGSPQANKFGASKMTVDDDKKFLTVMRQVASTATGFLDDLEPLGLTEETISDLSTLADSYEDSINAIASAKEIRDLKTQERVDKGNAIYALVSKYCEIGKMIWEDVDVAKYNDYVIYSEGSSGKPGKIQNLAFNNLTSALSWDISSPESQYYQLEISSDGEHFSVVYEDAPNVFNYGAAPATYYARCRGINDKGNGSWSDVLQFVKTLSTPFINLAHYNSTEKMLILQWNPVIYAESYDLYRSAVPIGNPAGEFVFYQSVINPGLEQEQTSFNLSLYFYIVAKLGSQSSEASNTVNVNVPM